MTEEPDRTCEDTDDEQNIFYVQDDPALRELVRYTLQRSGYRVEVCTNGREASRYVQNQSEPDLIILRIMLPNQNGFELVREMYREHDWDDVPTVILTVREKQEDRRMVDKHDIEEYLTIPFNPNRLVDRVEQHIEEESDS